MKEHISTKNGKKTYEFCINLGVPPGETKPFTTRRRGFPTKKAAWASYNLLKAQAAQGIFPARKSNVATIATAGLLTKEPTEDSTVSDYFNVYWESYLTKANESTTNDKTFNCFKNHILPWFGDLSLKEITPLKCNAFATSLINRFASARQMLTYFKSFLNEAKNMKLIKENPMDYVRIPTKSDVDKKKKVAGEEDVFFSNYYKLPDKAFLTLSKQHCTPLQHTFFYLLAHTGLRRGEAIALRWEDIDFDKKLIRVNKSAAYSTAKKLHLKTTKNRLTRKVNIDEETLTELRKWKEMQQRQLKMKNQYVKSDSEQFLFQNQYNALTNPSKCSDWLDKLYEKGNIKIITVHGLRHTHCTLGLQSRAFTIEEMMHRLGHRDIRITMAVYTHVTHEEMEGNVEVYREYLASQK